MYHLLQVIVFSYDIAKYVAIINFIFIFYIQIQLRFYANSLTLEKIMTDKHTALKAFRTALKREVRDREASLGRKIRTEIAELVGIKRSYLTDIANERKPGSEDVRRRIAQALNYQYGDFIKLGKLLLKGTELEEARHQIYEDQKCKFKPDGIIQELYLYWGELDEVQKHSAMEAIKNTALKNEKNKLDLRGFPTDKNKRFRKIWNIVFETTGLEPVFDNKTFDILVKYSDGSLTDEEVIEKAFSIAQEHVYIYDLMQVPASLDE